MRPRMLDTHSHLDQYPIPAIVALTNRAAAAGVGIVTVAVNRDSARRTVALTRLFPNVFGAVGLHPVYLTRPVDPDAWTELRDLCRDERVVAVGEIGLDYGDSPAPRDVQLDVFRRSLDLAADAGLPALLHLPPGGPEDDDASAVLAAGTVPGFVVHYFTGPPERAAGWLGRGAHLAFGKPVTRPGASDTRAACRATPLERLLLETDSYPLPERTTEPADVGAVAVSVADLHGVTVDAVAARTSANARALFRGAHLDDWLAG